MISAQSHRRHTIGVLLSQWKLQLVYQSRSYVVVSDALDIRQDRVKLTVAIAALWAASLETLGFDSHFVDNHGNPTVRSEGCQVAIEEQVHQIEKILFRSRSVFGRGTATLGTAGQVQAVIKFNCPPKSREPEATMLKRAQDIRNIIKVDACAVWGDTLQGFGPEFIKAVSRFEVREFRILVLSPFCVPLTEILELEDFKRSFRKLVIAHHELYKIGILHCDISVGNLMYDPVGKEPYLIDTDLGKPINELASPSSQHRTGTLPFMATDLLVERPPPHLYRHDLESFYYVLVWIVVPDHCGWHMVHSIASMRKEKSDFLAIGPDSADKIDRLIFDDRFEPLRQSWICHIHSNFLKGRAAVDPFLRNENSNTDTETLGGLITFDKFIALLQDSNELEQSLAQV